MILQHLNNYDAWKLGSSLMWTGESLKLQDVGQYGDSGSVVVSDVY